jgi:alpha-ketoglutarate-dependent taurine dioxygenase
MPTARPQPLGKALAAYERELRRGRSVLLQAGDALLIDNRRMLRMCDELLAAVRRWLTRYWVGDLRAGS